MFVFLAFLALFLAVAFGTGYFISAPKYQGPVSGHFNGSTFMNPKGLQAKGFLDVLKWSVQRERSSWNPVTDAEYGPAPPKKTHSVRITFINHSTFLLQVDGVNILTDPVYSERVSPFQWAGPKRFRPPGIRFEDLPPVDYVVISHNHYDHLDENTVKRLYRQHQPQFITPLGVGAYLKTLGIPTAHDLDWWQEYPVNDSLNIQSVPAQHFSGRGLGDRDATLWCGYAIKRPNGNLYFAGDTGYNTATFKEIGNKSGPFALSLIPIGAYNPKWFMSSIHVSPAEALQIHRDVQSRKSIAIHFGTFPLADDGQEEPVNDLQKARKEQGIFAEEFMVMKEGESFLLEQEER